MTGNPREQMVLKMDINREQGTRKINVDPSLRIIDIIREQGLPVDGVLVMSGGRPVPLDMTLGEIEKGYLKVINVASGG